ncbi:MAG: aldo/keto reductase, partial [Verrucomicrobiota bacterium]
PDTYRRFEYAIDRGLNYFDTASRYARGKSEEGLGMLAKLPGIRDRIFISTKFSDYYRRLDQLAKEIFDGLPGEKQSALQRKAKELVEERGIDKPGYFFQYFPSQRRSIEPSYLTHVVKQEYGYQSKWKSIISKELMETIETSLKRLNTDYVDVLHCPHGARIPEDLEDEIIAETFDKVKSQGKARFFALSSHTDASSVLSKAADLPHYDVAMVAYNIASHGHLDPAIRKATSKGMGIIAMKAAAGVFTKYSQLEIPDWRIQKLDHLIPEDIQIQPKAYLWALQNPNLSAVISEMFDQKMMDENFAIVGRKLEMPLA